MDGGGLPPGCEDILPEALSFCVSFLREHGFGEVLEMRYYEQWAHTQGPCSRLAGGLPAAW